jgi:hypothetical protein
VECDGRARAPRHVELNEPRSGGSIRRCCSSARLQARLRRDRVKAAWAHPAALVGQKLAYVYFEDELGRRPAAKLLSKDEA